MVEIDVFNARKEVRVLAGNGFDVRLVWTCGPNPLTCNGSVFIVRVQIAAENREIDEATNPLYRPVKFRIVSIGIDEKEREQCRA